MTVVAVTDELDEMRDRVRRETAAHDATRQDLAAVRRELDSCVVQLHSELAKHVGSGHVDVGDRLALQ